MPWFVAYQPERLPTYEEMVQQARRQAATENPVVMIGHNFAYQIWEFATEPEADTYIREHPAEEGFRGHAVQAEDIMRAARGFSLSLRTHATEEGWTF